MRSFILVALVCGLWPVSLNAQHEHHGNANKQNANAGADTVKAGVVKLSESNKPSRLFSSYYDLKNALVADDAASAAVNADEFLRIVNSADYKVLLEGNIHILAANAGNISSTRELRKQRENFSKLSFNLLQLAKSVRLNETPVFIQYCPMKKAYWLSADKEIRNPYYGKAMLTCGEVTDTLYETKEGL